MFKVVRKAKPKVSQRLISQIQGLRFVAKNEKDCIKTHNFLLDRLPLVTFLPVLGFYPHQSESFKLKDTQTVYITTGSPNIILLIFDL